MLSTPPRTNQNNRVKKDFENFNELVLYRENHAARKRSLNAPPPRIS
jgi:hypothetical protein